MALKLKGSTSGFVGLDAPAVAGNNTLILPDSAGSAHQILANDITAGVTTFTQVTVSRNGDLTVPGTISIGGTLTYEDVTSVDSVGIVTARGLSIFGNTSGLNVASGISTFVDVSARNLTVSAASTFTGNIKQTAPGSSTAKLTLNNESDTTGMDVGYSESSGLGFINVGQSGSGLSIKTGGSAAGNERLRIDSSGNTNFGVEKSVALPSGTGIQVYHSANPRIKLANDTTGNGATDGTQIYLSSDGDTIIDNKDSEDIIFHSNASEKLRLTSSGRLLLGTTTEGYGDADDLNIATSAHTGMTIRSGTSSLGTIAFSDGTSGQAEYKGFVQYNHSQDTLHLGSAHQSKATINADGNTKFVGIVTATSFESTTFSKTPTNTPAFHAWSNNVTSHSWPEASLTKVEFLNSETFDTDSAYDNSTSGTTANRFTVPTGKGGYYQISAGLNFYANANDIRHARAVVKHNTNVAITAYGLVAGSSDGDIRHFQVNISGILQLAAGDYIELFGYLDTNSNSQGYISNDANGYRGNHFSAYKLII